MFSKKFATKEEKRELLKSFRNGQLKEFVLQILIEELNDEYSKAISKDFYINYLTKQLVYNNAGMLFENHSNPSIRLFEELRLNAIAQFLREHQHKIQPGYDVETECAQIFSEGLPATDE